MRFAQAQPAVRVCQTLPSVCFHAACLGAQPSAHLLLVPGRAMSRAPCMAAVRF